MAGYTRNDTSNNIATGNVINAADLDGEFDALVAAFHASTGHTHDGTAANGAPITKIGPAQDLVISTGAITPKTDNTVDLGSSSFEFKDLYIDGTANIDALVADTADINAGTIDGTTIGGSTAAAGSFTTLTTSSTVTLNGGTANGVLYLNGSKVATSGSALVFDGANLGVGDSSPIYRLDVSSPGSTGAVVDVARIFANAGSTATARLLFGTTANAANVAISGYTTSATDADMLFYTDDSGGLNERMRLTSTGLGIGTSSLSYTASGRGNVNIAGSAGAILGFQIGGSAKGYVFHDNTNLQLWNEVAGPILFGTNGQTRATLDSSGNLGLGVTPSAWNVGKVMQFDTGGAFVFGDTSQFITGVNAYYQSAWKYTGTGAATKYESTAGVHRWFTAPSGTAGNAITFTQAMTLNSSGSLAVGSTTANRAAANTGISVEGASTAILESNVNASRAGFLYADAASTIVGEFRNFPLIFRTNDTERARITSGGDLLVGTTTSPSGSLTGAGIVTNALFVARTSIISGNASVINVSHSGGIYYGIMLKNESTNQSNALVFMNSSDAGVGTIAVTTTSTTYNTSSDYRLKENIQPMTGALAKVAALKPCTYKWKADGSDGEGFIAHELAEVVPQCVTGEKDAVDEEGKPVYQGIDTSFLVATLTAAIQEQQTIINQLKARLDAANL